MSYPHSDKNTYIHPPIGASSDLATFDTPVSYFRNAQTTDAQTITLKKWLCPPQSLSVAIIRQIVDEIRQTRDKEAIRLLKNKLPAIAPSCIVESRSTGAEILSYTGWMQFDIDAKDHPHLSLPEIKSEIGNIVYVAYCGLSCSGQGIWGLVKISDPMQLKSHHIQLQKDFNTIGIKLDAAGCNPRHLRFFSIDRDPYLNLNAKTYDRLKPQLVRSSPSSAFKYSGSSVEAQVERCLAEIGANGIDVAPTYDQYFKLVMAFCNEFGETGRDYFHMATSVHRKYDKRQHDLFYSRCLNKENNYRGKKISIATFFHLCKNAGIEYGS